MPPLIDSAWRTDAATQIAVNINLGSLSHLVF